jgi:pyrrolidone-carboxylate peptidase
MENKENPQREVIDLLEKAIDFYKIIYGVIDIDKSEMPVVSEDSDDILQTYLMLYGKQDNRHGGFDTSEDYKSFMKKAQGFSKLPEVNKFAQRIEKARANLETTIKKIDPKVVLELGYELREDDNRLLVYNKE